MSGYVGMSPPLTQDLIVKNTFYEIPEARTVLRRVASDGEISGSSSNATPRSKEDFSHVVWSSSEAGDRSEYGFSSDDNLAEHGMGSKKGRDQFCPPQQPSASAQKLYRELVHAAETGQTGNVQMIRAQLEEHIPRDNSGRLTSLGTIRHFEYPVGHKCMPCAFFSMGACEKGSSCLSCHMPASAHKQASSREGKQSESKDSKKATSSELVQVSLEQTKQLVNELLTRPNVADRVNAATALGKMSPPTPATRGAFDIGTNGLAKALKDQHFKVRAAATTALGTLGPHVAMHSATIVDMLQDPYFEVRAASCFALGKLGGAAVPALQSVAALVTALKDKQHLVRASAASAIGVLGLSHQVPANGLAALLVDPNATVRASAAYSLGKLGNAAIPHAAALARMLQDENARVRESGAHAIGKLEEAAIPHMNLLISVLHDEHPGVRGASANALGNLGDIAKPYANELAGMLKDSNVDVCASAAFAFGKLDDAAMPYIGMLRDMVNDPRAKIRKAAGCALGKLGYEVVNARDGSRTYEVTHKGIPNQSHEEEMFEGKIITL